MPVEHDWRRNICVDISSSATEIASTLTKLSKSSYRPEDLRLECTIAPQPSATHPVYSDSDPFFSSRSANWLARKEFMGAAVSTSIQVAFQAQRNLRNLSSTLANFLAG
jgi:hypothetical protein